MTLVFVHAGIDSCTNSNNGEPAALDFVHAGFAPGTKSILNTPAQEIWMLRELPQVDEEDAAAHGALVERDHPLEDEKATSGQPTPRSGSSRTRSKM